MKVWTLKDKYCKLWPEWVCTTKKQLREEMEHRLEKKEIDRLQLKITRVHLIEEADLKWQYQESVRAKRGYV